MSFLPREYSNVLQFDNYTSTGSAFPLLKNSEYEQLLQGETGTNINNKYKLFNVEKSNEKIVKLIVKMILIVNISFL